jgi:hypothetical protein
LSWRDNGKNNGKGPKIEIIIEDREENKKIIVAQYQKSIILPESYCEEMAEVIYEFLHKNTSKLAGRVKEDYRNLVFYEKLLNDKPFEIKHKREKEKRFYNKKRVKRKQAVRF